MWQHSFSLFKKITLYLEIFCFEIYQMGHFLVWIEYEVKDGIFPFILPFHLARTKVHLSACLYFWSWFQKEKPKVKTQCGLRQQSPLTTSRHFSGLLFRYHLGLRYSSSLNPEFLRENSEGKAGINICKRLIFLSLAEKEMEYLPSSLFQNNILKYHSGNSEHNSK